MGVNYIINPSLLSGYYCPGGGILPIRCEPGTYNLKLGASDVSECLDCPAGYYCPEPGMSNGRLYPCADGFFCTSKSTVARPSENSIVGGPCPLGEFCENGLRNTCERGRFCDQLGTTRLRSQILTSKVWKIS